MLNIFESFEVQDKRGITLYSAKPLCSTASKSFWSLVRVVSLWFSWILDESFKQSASNSYQFKTWVVSLRMIKTLSCTTSNLFRLSTRLVSLQKRYHPLMCPLKLSVFQSKNTMSLFHRNASVCQRNNSTLPKSIHECVRGSVSTDSNTKVRIEALYRFQIVFVRVLGWKALLRRAMHVYLYKVLVYAGVRCLSVRTWWIQEGRPSCWLACFAWIPAFLTQLRRHRLKKRCAPTKTTTCFK